MITPLKRYCYLLYTTIPSIIFFFFFGPCFIIFIQVPLRLRYPFYGCIHWYVLSKYAKELRRFTARRKDAAKSTFAEGSDSHNLLNEVTVEKCAISPPVCNVEDAATPSVITLQPDVPLDCTTELVTQSPCDNLEEPPETLLISDKTGDIDCSLPVEPPSPTMLKPHFSNHERGGLLLLVQKMKSNLFQLDVPISIVSSSDLLQDLEYLLQSAMSENKTSLEPNGVGILASNEKEPPKIHIRKRTRKCSVENLTFTKSKILNETCIDTSYDISKHSKSKVETKEIYMETISNSKLESNLDISDSSKCSNFASLPSASTMADTSIPSSHSPVSTTGTAEIVLGVTSVCSPVTTICPCEHDVQTMAELHNLGSVGGLLCARSPAPLHSEEVIITKLMNPSFIDS